MKNNYLYIQCKSGTSLWATSRWRRLFVCGI